MYNRKPSKIQHLKELVARTVMLVTFYLLPARVSKTFVFLSILSMIKICRPGENANYIIDSVMFKRLLSMNYEDEILLVPQSTAKFFWDDSFMTKSRFINGEYYTFKDIVNSKELSSRYKDVIIEEMVDYLPKTLRNKLKLSNKRNKEKLITGFSNLLLV